MDQRKTISIEAKFSLILIIALILICYVLVKKTNLIANNVHAAEGVAPDNNDTINVCDYGMIGDGNYDNSQILISLLDNYSSLYFPAGQYYIASEITISKGITLTGETQDSSILIFDGTSLPHNWNLRIKCDGFSASNISFVLKKMLYVFIHNLL